MRLVWSPEAASEAYIDTVKLCGIVQESGVAELISAMAAGWKSKLVVETWSRGGAIATSIGLAIASRHTGGRHVCLVQDEETGSQYRDAMKTANLSPEVIIGTPDDDDVMAGLVGVDFLVIDGRISNYMRMLRVVKLGCNGAVVICKNAAKEEALGNSRSWRSDQGGGIIGGGWRRVVRSLFLPVGKGVQIIHVGGEKRKSAGGASTVKGMKRRWIKHVDLLTGEEHMVRK